MQTDTVVGIVGAVVLVSVMVGVFAYEYNNTGDGGDGDDVDGGDDGFAQRYPGLDPDGDMDGDGVPNAEDPDMDGDDLADAEDDELLVTQEFDGTVAQSAGSTSSDQQILVLDEGATSVEMTVAYQRPAGLPGAIGQQPKLNFVLTDPNGQTYAAQETLGGAGDAGVTVTWAFAGDLPAGEWTLTATSNSVVAPAMSYDGTLAVGYAGA